MGLLDHIRNDAKAILSNSDDFGVAISFTAPGGATKTVTGLGSKHHFAVNGEGTPASSKQAHITVHESSLTDAPAYTVRDANGEVALNGHQVQYADSTGTSKTYVITTVFPDETLGVIVCNLADLE